MFKTNLVKVYVTRFFGIIASMLSYAIVIPKISSNINAYGIYTVVVSLLVLLQYADFGFLGAGQKYAAESVAKHEKETEIKILSFTHFILFVFVLIYIVFLSYLYFNPKLMFNNLQLNDIGLVKSLILIFIASSGLIVFQRYISAIFIIRIEDYLLQSVEIVSSLIKIASTFYFFNNTKYDIVGYLIFFQTMNFVSIIINLFIIKKRYNYDFGLVFKYFKFNREIFRMTSKMAFTSIGITISWILYFEMDSIYVSKLYSPSIVAYYAIGITILSFSRTLMNAFFSPFQTKFNHLRALNENKTLESFFIKLIELSLPISIIPAISIFVLMNPLIVSWIGNGYLNSVIISRIFILNLVFAFLTTPIGYLAMAKEKFRFLWLTTIILPVCYLIFFISLNYFFGIYTLAISKVLTITTNLIISLFLIKSVFSGSLARPLFNMFKLLVLPFLLMTILLFFTKPLWDVPMNKSLFSFIKIVSIGFSISLLAMGLYYFTNKNTHTIVFGFLNKLVRFKLN